jgi:hypothetical protein
MLYLHCTSSVDGTYNFREQNVKQGSALRTLEAIGRLLATTAAGLTPGARSELFSKADEAAHAVWDRFAEKMRRMGRWRYVAYCIRRFFGRCQQHENWSVVEGALHRILKQTRPIGMDRILINPRDDTTEMVQRIWNERERGIYANQYRWRTGEALIRVLASTPDTRTYEVVQALFAEKKREGYECTDRPLHSFSGGRFEPAVGPLALLCANTWKEFDFHRFAFRFHCDTDSATLPCPRVLEEEELVCLAGIEDVPTLNGNLSLPIISTHWSTSSLSTSWASLVTQRRTYVMKNTRNREWAVRSP